jgi:hypothetical protein
MFKHLNPIGPYPEENVVFLNGYAAPVSEFWPDRSPCSPGWGDLQRLAVSQDTIQDQDRAPSV